MVDWSGKLEAVHEDGRVIPVAFNSWADSGSEVYTDSLGLPVVWKADGNSWQRETGWTVRNAASDAPTSPDKGSPDADSENQVFGDTQGLQARCEAFVRDLATYDGTYGNETAAYWAEEAAKIVREFDPIAALIDDLMAQDLPERDRLAKAYEAGRNTPA